MKIDEKFDSLRDEDIDDVVGIAAELMEADDESLSRSEMVAVGRDLDIPEEYLDRAYAELQQRRRAAQRAERREAGRRRRLLTLGGTGVAATVFIATMWGMFTVNGLSKLHARVEAQSAQVANVVERQKAVEERWADMPNTPDKMAALDGSENRIRVETKRYAEAASAYNARANRFPATLFLGFSSLPASVPEKP
jgi:hypothetical protein